MSRFPQPFSMPDALLLPLLLPILRLPPPLLAFPLRPPPRLSPALLTAIARHRMPRPVALPASFQQTLPAPRSSCRLSSFLLVVELISLASCRIVTGAHGRARSRKAQVSEGMALLSEAPYSSIFVLPSGDSRTH